MTGWIVGGAVVLVLGAIALLKWWMRDDKKWSDESE